MLLDQAQYGGVHMGQVEGFSRGQQQRLVPVRTLSHRLLEEPLLHRGQRCLAADRTLINGDGNVGLANLCQAAHGLVLEQVPRAEGNPGLTGTTDDLDGNNGVAAQFEEIVFQTDLFHA
ncbi:hypothetical protein [Pseudomonas sp. 25 R 14]|nr:hypothetical protein [Pseudomonas sp. 25 R 14]